MPGSIGALPAFETPAQLTKSMRASITFADLRSIL